MSLLRRKISPTLDLNLDNPTRSIPAARPIFDALRADIVALFGLPMRLAHSAKSALVKPRVRKLTLELTDRTVTFNGPTEFDFALESRTEFPVNKIAVLMERPPEELKRVATNIRQVEKRFAEVLTLSLAEPGAIGELVREVELKLFSQDHGWRDIVEALNRQPPAFDEYKRIALVKYMQYLASRQNVLKSIYAEKTSGSNGDPSPPPSREYGDDVADATEIVVRGSAESAAHPPEATQLASMKDTSIFDLGAASGSDAVGRTYEPLPRGESVCMHLCDGEPLRLRLSSHSFELRAGASFQLVDDSGATYLLAEGKNVVGRHASSDIVVDGAYRSVSRKHLIVEPVSDQAVLLTDISSHGTFVPVDATRD